MSSRESYSQKKKREAVRRLSQQHTRQAGRSVATSLFSEPLRRRKSLEKRRSHDEAGLGTRQKRRDEGKRFISPMNNPNLASSSSAPDNAGGGLFGKPSNIPPNSSESVSEVFSQGKTAESPPKPSIFAQTSSSGTSLFSQASTSGTSLFSQKSAFTGTSTGLFGKPSVSSSTSVFGSSSSTFGSFGTQPSLFGQGIDSDSSVEEAGTKQPSFQVTFDSGGDDEAGGGRTVETSDAPRSDRRVLTRDSAARESERSSGSFGHSSPLKDGGATSRRTSLKRDLSPSKPTSASQRPLTSHDDVFGSDISDLESFGSVSSKPKLEKESMQGRAAVKRSGLFERAIDDASGRRDDLFKKKRGDERSPEDSLRGKKQSSVFVSSNVIKHLTTIIVKDVPEELNNRSFLNTFFSKYGRVKKISANPRKTMATVYFEDHQSAARAKHEVKTLEKGTRPVAIFWTQKDKSKEKRKSDENVPPPSIERKIEVDQQQKREKPSAPPPPASSVGRSAKGYHTASERYDALEERDKQIRKGLTKQSDLATAKKMTGTCPDMCPEKERYMREVQRRLSPYETDTGRVEKGENHVCHMKAVKEYSRSSADQEEPLPSELRPPAVLDLTMNYLMGEIMNREPTGLGGDGRSWADWFDFLWNRTRSIRKEITQQQLCGTTAVSLMEKCARFHIYCSYRLCEEDHMAFDPKINNENLTKCLQSLKQFYHDLADEGVFCPNEAEFRAYEVLLNLTGGDILREVQQYRPEVRNSEAVVFSLKVSAAFSSNNYRRFFKLIRSASFLNACILHRYFVQLRCLALETMNKAFTTPKGVSMFPTAELVHLLAFEDDDQASLFCECHGLRTLDGCIQLSRGGFYYPVETLTSQRAPSVIEAKNDRSIGEVVNNGPLPVAQPHTPFSSFDQNGRLFDRVVEAKPKPIKEVQQTERMVEMKVPQETVSEITQQPVQIQQGISAVKVEESKPTVSTEAIKDITKELFLEVIDEMVKDLSLRFMDTLAIIQASPQVLADIIQEEMSILSHRVAMETLEEEKNAEAKRRAAAEEASRKEKEMNALREEASRKISEEILEEVVERTLELIIENEISAYRSELRKQAMDRCSSMVAEELLHDLVRSEALDVSSEVIAVATAERDRRLEEIAEAYRLRQLAYLYQKWCRVHKKRVKIRRALETFPAGPPNQNTAEQLEVLWPRQREQSIGPPTHVDTDMVSKSRLSLPMSLETPYGVVSERESLAKHIMHHHYLTLVRQQRAWEPLDLPTIHVDNARSSQHASRSTRQHDVGCRYWKLVASLPQGSYDDRSPCLWLKAKLRRGKLSEHLRRSRLRDNESVETLSLFTQRVGSTPLGICTKAIIGLPGGNDARYQLIGNSGIILIVEGETQACFKDAGQRLKAMLSQIPSRPSLPVLGCVISDEDLTTFQRELSQSLQLHQLTQIEVIACWKLIRIPRDIVKVEASEQLEEGIAWLASHHPDPPSMVNETVKEYLDNGLTQFFSTNVHQLSKQRRETGQFPLSPQSIMSLYNSVMNHLASVASSSSLSDISWPPSEFTNQQHPDLPATDWNMPASLNNLCTTINSLQLPKMPYIQDNDWLSVCDASVGYVHRLPGLDSDKAPLLSRVRWLLDKSRRTFEDTCFMTLDTEGCEPTSQHAPWADILEECVTYMMTTLAGEQEGDSPSFGSQQVYFNQCDLNRFEFPIEWKQEMNQTLEESVVEHESMQHSIVEAVTMRQSTLAEEEEREREEWRRKKAKERLLDNTSFLLLDDDTMNISHTQSSLLRRMLDKEREENLRFEAMLTSFLEEEPVSVLQHSLHVPTSKPESEFRLQLPPLPKASLASSLKDSEPTTHTPTITLEEADDNLSGQIQSLKERLTSEKQAALMAEMRLNALLGL